MDFPAGKGACLLVQDPGLGSPDCECLLPPQGKGLHMQHSLPYRSLSEAQVLPDLVPFLSVLLGYMKVFIAALVV